MSYHIDFRFYENIPEEKFDVQNLTTIYDEGLVSKEKSANSHDFNKPFGLYTKTKHFRKRQQERHIPNDALAKILSEIKASYADEVRLIVPRNLMKKCKITHLGTNLILVMNSHKLITIFAIPNLTDYFYNCKRDCKHYLLN